MMRTTVLRLGYSAISVMLLLAVSVRDGRAQDTDPNPGALTLTASTDVVTTYMFRGILQDDTKLMTWPAADLGIALHSGDGAVKAATLNLGSWNSLHPGAGGTEGPTEKLWYEGDFYATLGLTFRSGLGLSSTYTAYTSPNNRFSTVKELAVKASFADPLGLNPYGLIAFEFDTAPGRGQADGGLEAGRYLELGMAVPINAVGSKMTLALPVKLGLSLGNYYEHPLTGEDSTFGYASIGALATVPLGGTTSRGAWNVHAGIEHQRLGDTTKAFNGGDSGKTIVSLGLGFSY